MISAAIRFYKTWISPALHSIAGIGFACRFQPTCSEYAAVAFERHGVFRGLGLTVWRLLRCNPFGRGGFDPVPAVHPHANIQPGSSAGAIYHETRNTPPARSSHRSLR